MLREDYDKLINSIWDDRHHVEELNKELIKEFLLGQLVVGFSVGFVSVAVSLYLGV